MHHIFDGVIIIGLVAGDPGMFWQIKVVTRQGAGIAESTRHAEELNRFSLLNNEDMDSDAIKMPTVETALAQQVRNGMLMDFSIHLSQGRNLSYITRQAA